MIRLVHEPIDTAALRDVLVRPEDGAVAIFEGVVRDHAHGRPVRYLEYQAYESMAQKTLEEIAALAKREFHIREISILHRLGRLHHAECSVAIVVTAAHRAAAFDACRFAIDAIKKTVPIWKKEFYEDGEVWVEGPESVTNDE
jgi:molybdopterin synthase catalytic subunit